MKNKKCFYLILFIIPISIFLLIVANIFYVNNAENISEIKLSIIVSSNIDEYIFKENENIIKLLEIVEDLKTFQSEDDINMPYADIVFNIKYNNNKIIKRSYKIRPYRELFEDIFNSIEAKNQNN